MACLPNIVVMAPSDEAGLINMVTMATTIDDKPRTRDNVDEVLWHSGNGSFCISCMGHNRGWEATASDFPMPAQKCIERIPAMLRCLMPLTYVEKSFAFGYGERGISDN
ncbi:hypothetical protein Tco_0539562 [Tanacetum coccineum]